MELERCRSPSQKVGLLAFLCSPSSSSFSLAGFLPQLPRASLLVPRVCPRHFFPFCFGSRLRLSSPFTRIAGCAGTAFPKPSGTLAPRIVGFLPFSSRFRCSPATFLFAGKSFANGSWYRGIPGHRADSCLLPNVRSPPSLSLNCSPSLFSRSHSLLVFVLRFPDLDAAVCFSCNLADGVPRTLLCVSEFTVRFFIPVSLPQLLQSTSSKSASLEHLPSRRDFNLATSSHENVCFTVFSLRFIASSLLGV